MRSGYLESMTVGGVDTELNALHREALAQVDDSPRLAELCGRMQNLVTKPGVSPDVRDELLAAYQRRGSNTFVAV